VYAIVPAVFEDLYERYSGGVPGAEP
jgi:hypothetical protein